MMPEPGAAVTVAELAEALKTVRVWLRPGRGRLGVALRGRVLHPHDVAADLAIAIEHARGQALTAAPHYHDATGQENTPCLCARPGTYARQAPNPLED